MAVIPVEIYLKIREIGAEVFKLLLVLKKALPLRNSGVMMPIFSLTSQNGAFSYNY